MLTAYLSSTELKWDLAQIYCDLVFLLVLVRNFCCASLNLDNAPDYRIVIGLGFT